MTHNISQHIINNHHQLSIINCPLSIVHYPLLIAFCLLLSVNAFAQYGGGTGTSSDPYIISTSTHLSNLASAVNGGNAYSSSYFKLTANINSGATMIGSSSKPFSGTFDGGNHTITVNLSGSSNYMALFPKISGATIKNLIVGGSVNSTTTFAAGIVSDATNSTIYNCTNNASVDGTVNIGGVVSSCNSSRMEKCVNNGTIGGSRNASKRGGVASTISYSTIIECTNNGNVYGLASVGGIAFSAGGSSSNPCVIDKCINNGLIQGSEKPDPNQYLYWGFGGIIGGCRQSGKVTIINSYNTGTVKYTGQDVNTEYYNLGGILGNSTDNGVDDINIKNCYNIGDVKTNNNNGKGIGGIIGYSANATIQNCYNGYKVSNTCSNYANVGAIAGYATTNTRISNCYGWEESAVTTCSNQSYNMQLAGTNYYSPTTTQSAWFKHNSNNDNKLISDVSVNGRNYTASNTNSLLSVLKAWVTANGNDYLTWVDASSESDNKGMPKLKFCTPVSTTISRVTSSHRKNVVEWTASPQNATCTYSVSWTSVAGNGNSSATSPFNHTNLTNDIEYCYRVVAVGTGDYCDVNKPSAQVCGTPHCTQLDAPSLNIQSTGDRTVTVNWGAVSGSGVVSYKLYYGSNSSSMWEVTPDSNPYQVLRLTNGQTYNFKIKAVGDEEHCGEDNPFSTPLKQATPNCP